MPSHHYTTALQLPAKQGGTLSRLVYARMRRSTERQASVPLLTKRTISTLGTRSITIFASTFSSSQGAPNEVPCAAEGLLTALAHRQEAPRVNTAAVSAVSRRKCACGAVKRGE